MKTAIIGGGVAGCMAAAVAARQGEDVTVFERNEKPLKKMFITGKGRCNVTNYCGCEEFLKNVVRNPKFLYSALKEFDCYSTYALFETLGVPLKVEHGDRVFPASDKSGDITRALEKYASGGGAKFRIGDRVASIKKNENGFTVSCKGSAGEVFDRVILATGGLSYPLTGSTGDGYRFAGELGHTVIAPIAALSAIYTREEFTRDLAGLTLKNVRLSCFENGKKIYEEQGEMLFTHKGVSGPLVLSLSSRINRSDFKELSLSIDLKPALSAEVLESRVLRDFSAVLNREFKNALGELLPKSLIPVVIERSGISPEKKVNSVTAKERSALVNLLKAFRLSPVALAPVEEAIVTSGGVSCAEINPRTMESKKVPGLFFAGEIIDVDGLTGGYNIQIALTTGYAAGKNGTKS